MLCDKFARLCVFVALLVGSIWFPAPANANVIYSDTFTGTDGTALNGHVLDVTTGGASWNATSSLTLQGGTAATPAKAAASLPFVPTSGYVYTLSADVSVAAGTTTKWAGMGFANADYTLWGDGVLQYSLPDFGYAWMFQRDNGQVYAVPGLGTDGIYQCNDVTTGVTHHYSVVLDTTKTNWSATWLVDSGTVYQSTYSDSGAAGIQYVMLYSNGAPGSYDNLTLSYTTPEPSALSLLIVGVISLLAYAWRKRK